VGYDDATKFSEVFGGEDVIIPQDLTNLRKYDIYTKLLIDGMPSPVFSATTYAPLHDRMDIPLQQSRDVLLKVSREKYTKKKDYVEKKIFEYASKIQEDEKKYRREQEEYKEKIKSEKDAERKKKLEEKSS
jgi:Mitoribosomal protein mL52